jgi:hypothetical protein
MSKVGLHSLHRVSCRVGPCESDSEESWITDHWARSPSTQILRDTRRIQGCDGRADTPKLSRYYLRGKRSPQMRSSSLAYRVRANSPERVNRENHAVAGGDFPEVGTGTGTGTGTASESGF